jgi:hypothetical protein
MRILCSHCQESVGIPAGLLNDGPGFEKFWEGHGHRPARYTVICACGEELQIPQGLRETIDSWRDMHLSH